MASVWALAFGSFAFGTTEFAAMGLLPEIADGVDVTIPVAGRLVSGYALGAMVGAPLLACVARLPRRAVLIGLMTIYALANVASAIAPSYNSLLIARFVAGLPHCAAFGIAGVIAADMVGPGYRARAVARVLLGLAVANVVGVPFVTWLGQSVGWRFAFVACSGLSAAAAAAIYRFVPWTRPDESATLRRELSILQRPQVWLALATGAIGGSGLFAVYSYISPILTERSGLPLQLVPVALACLGLGMVAGSLLGGRLMDWRPIPAMFIVFAVMTALFAIFVVTSARPATAVITLFFIGTSLALPTGLQLRLMDVSGDSQTLGAALNHSAFNLGNALGAWLGGLVLAAGLGLTAPMWVGVTMTVLGMGIYAGALMLERRGPSSCVLT